MAPFFIMEYRSSPSMKPFESLRFLELGEAPLVKRLFPGQTDFFNTAPRRAWGSEPYPTLGVSQLAEKLGAGAVDLVVLQPASHAPWHPLSLIRTFFNRRSFTSQLMPHRPFGPALLRLLRETPLAVLDYSDVPYIEPGKLHLLDRSTLYFKRELPADQWKLFTKTATPTQPSQRFRRKSRYGALLGKLRPISLGLPLDSESDFPAGPLEKTADLFFAGTVEDMPVRQRALAELETLAAEGIVIDRPREKIDRPAFYRRCGAAWLTLSPEGFGWDCFRHYEAAACGSVPLMNMPGIVRHAPYTEGVDALFYPPEPGGLARVVRKALADRQALSRIGEAARAHVMRHHTTEAIMRYVIEETLAAASALRK